MRKKQEIAGKKLTQGWEYWPWYYIYIPVWIFRLVHSVKLGSLTYVYYANPGMLPAGPLQFSKWQILQQFPQELIPQTYIVDRYSDLSEIKEKIEKLGGEFIVKPDVGERGVGIKVLKNFQELITYQKEIGDQTFLVQELIDMPLEFGVMYYRYPESETGEVTGITMKEFMTVTGDGINSLRQLVASHKRGCRYEKTFEEMYGENYDTIVSAGEVVQLSKIGNHSKGTKFVDSSDLIDERIHPVFDDLLSHVDGLNYGRIDIKAKSIDSLYTGEGLSVLEVNGIQSEPAHMYDPKYNLSQGYKELFKHWKIMVEVSRQHMKNPTLDRIPFLPHLFKDFGMAEIYWKTPRYICSLQELTEAMYEHINRQQEVYGNVSLARSKYILERYSGDDWKDLVTFDLSQYTRYVVPQDGTKNGLFDLVVIGRSAKQESGPHDHAQQGCIFKVVDGEIIEKKYKKDGDEFRRNGKVKLSLGKVTHISNDIGYHSLGASKRTSAVTVHVYAPGTHKTSFHENKEENLFGSQLENA